MKRIYATLALLGAFAFGSQAQNVDIEALCEVGLASEAAAGPKVCLGKTFSPSVAPTGDSLHGIFALLFKGPDGVFPDDKVTIRTSFNRFLTQAECDAQNPPVPFADRYAWYSILTVSQQMSDNGFYAFSFEKTDSIGMLLDWARWQQYGEDSIRVYGPPHENFTNGQVYGMFVRTWGMGESANAIVNTDDTMENNWSVVKIQWNNCTTGIEELFAPRDKVNISVFPNPADNQISVAYKFEQNANTQIYVRDLTGRTVKSKNLGHIKAGDRNFSVDISGLTPGIYTLELNGGDFVGVSKFTKK